MRISDGSSDVCSSDLVAWRFLLACGRGRAAPFRQNGFDAGDVAPHLTNPRRALQLARGLPEAQVELLLLERQELVLQLVVGLGANVLGLHQTTSSPRRAINLVPIGSFAAASANAYLARSPGTPSTSTLIRPGLTRHHPHTPQERRVGKKAA